MAENEKSSTNDVRFRCCLLCVVGFFQHQMFEFPQRLIVIYTPSLRKIHGTTEEE